MKISLSISKEKYEEIEQKLLSLGFEIADDAPFVLTERNTYAEAHLNTTLLQEIMIGVMFSVLTVWDFTRVIYMKFDIENGGIPSADTHIDIAITME